MKRTLAFVLLLLLPCSQAWALDPSVRRLLNPHTYPVGLSTDLYESRRRLIEQARSGAGSPPSKGLV